MLALVGAWGRGVMRPSLGTSPARHLLLLLFFSHARSAQDVREAVVPLVTGVLVDRTVRSPELHLALDDGARVDEAEFADMLQAAADGQGVALARLSLFAGDVRNGVLVRPFPTVVAAAFRTYLVYPPRVASSAKLMSFRAWLRDEIAAESSPPRLQR